MRNEKRKHETCEVKIELKFENLRIWEWRNNNNVDDGSKQIMYQSNKDSDRQKSKRPIKQATSFWLTKPWQNALALLASIAATVMLPHEEWNELQNELHIRRLALITAVPFGFLFTSTKSAWFGPQVYAHWNAFTLTKQPGQWPAADRQ